MKNFLKILTILFLGIIGCGKKEPYVPDLSKEINYHHYVIQYMGEIVSYKYYNDKNQLIEEVGHEYRTKFIYDNQGKVVEKYNCRMYNCETGYRVILRYDDNSNYLGPVTITGKPGEYDTTKFEQIVYYDQDNHRIKERSDKGNDVNGEAYEIWKYYTYENNKISVEIETDNADTVWIGKYQYDSKGNLISISRQRSGKYENETFEYDDSNKLIKQTIENNEYPAPGENDYRVNNSTTTYKYDEQSRLVEEITYSHSGKKVREFVYKYETKK